MSEPVEPLQDAIRKTHGCESVWVEFVPVTETHDGEIVCAGEVQVFDLPGFKEASRC